MKFDYSHKSAGVLRFLILFGILLQSSLWAIPTEVSFIREVNPMVATQRVKLSFDGKEIAKLGHGKTVTIESETGKHTLQTKVGLSLGVPNVTGFNGAKKFKAKVTLDQPKHFFKVVFKPALMGGKHHIIEIDAAEYEALLKKK